MTLVDFEREAFQVQAAGHSLAVERLGPVTPGQPTLVFLHEGLGSIAQWRNFPHRLCRALGLSAVIYDRWGFGKSDPLKLPRPNNYLEIEAEVALPELLEACGVSRPILIGHSDGGSIALLFATAFPSRPLACVTMAAHVFVEDEALTGIREARHAWQTTKLRDRLAHYHGDKVDAVFSGWVDTWLRPDFRDWSMVERLARIACPLLALQGLDDAYGTPKQVETIVEGVSGPAQPLLLKDCGHTPYRERTEETLGAIIAFLGLLLSAQESRGASCIGFPEKAD
jgi:pimeloyl-ACP methyl ester carboxylesterase